MSRVVKTLGAVALGLMFATPVVAQESAVTPKEHAVTISAWGGGLSALNNLDDAGTSDFKTGFNVGGGVAVQLQRYISLRGDFNYGRDQLRLDDFNTGVHYNKFFYGGAVQVQYPTAGGVMPYAFAGGGGITIDPEGDNGSSKTKGAGLFGLGLEYQIPRTNWGVFAQSTGWLYKLDGLDGPLTGVNKTQFDVTYSGGISYRIPF